VTVQSPSTEAEGGSTAESEAESEVGSAPEEASLGSWLGRHKGRVLFGLAVVLASLASTVGVIFAVVYEKSTAVDRTNPIVTVDAFMHAVAVQADQAQVGLYTCAQWPAAAAFAETMDLLDPQARGVTWDTFVVVSQSGTEAVLTVRVGLRYEGEVAPSGATVLRLRLVNEQGWRVCAVQPAG